uniref:Uncharacterized protein n=1 Tax=Pseudo-nitzschia australis TaxID=44445 RepID=A0A7S4AX69_9STRA
MKLSVVVYFALLVVATTGQILDNRETCSHRVINCDPNVNHFETKVSMKHSSSVKRLDYKNTYILLEQAWPTRGPWMKNTAQRVVFVRCGCPVPNLSADWSDANIIHIPVSSVMVQMPNTLSKVYMMGQRSKVAAIESSRWISDATPEIATDIRDGIIRRLDLSPNGIPSTRITLSFTSGLFPDASTGFRLQLVDEKSAVVMGETECIFPASGEVLEPFETTLDSAFNSIPGWVDAGNVWVLKTGEASVEPNTSLSYTLYFDNQLPMGLTLRGEANTCGGDVNFKIERDSAPNNRPIYHRLHDLPGGFPDVLITEPRSLGPLADDPKILARQFIDSDPGEATPLGRSELMKLVALLVGSVETGNTLFETIETRYNDVKTTAAKARKRPTVMVGKPGTWNEAARNSWMITVGSTYVGQFLRDANVEYRNSDDEVNKELCGSGCGVCPSGTSDTRCSLDIVDYLDLFRSADYWISAGIGANCWSASCNFEITSDDLLDENRDIYSQFLPMQCGSVIGLDKSQNGSGNKYWELGRLRPDLVLMDLVTLMHPDLEVQEETTFFRMLPPLSNSTGMSPCLRATLPMKPEKETVHVVSIFTIDMADPPSTSNIIGPSHFAILERFYPSVNIEVAKALNVDVLDLEMGMSNNGMQVADNSSFQIAVTVRVPNCQDHSCAVEVGVKLAALGKEIEKALDLPWIFVQRDTSKSTVVLDHESDIIPLLDLAHDNDPIAPVTSINTTDRSNDSDSRVGVLVGIVVGALAVILIAVFVTYKVAYQKGAKDTLASYENEKRNKKDGKGDLELVLGREGVVENETIS